MSTLADVASSLFGAALGLVCVLPRNLILHWPFVHGCAASLQSEIVRREAIEVAPAFFGMRTLPGSAERRVAIEILKELFSR